MTRLWIHECFRVFSDRLIDDNDRENFVYLMTEKLGTLFDQTYHNICPNKQPPIFGKLVSHGFEKKKNRAQLFKTNDVDVVS